MTTPDAAIEIKPHPRICALPALLVNQIAAGEVVERPASVVKELIDNAVDARSTAITIELEQGGVELIRIADDGSGIDSGDLSLALAPHATSKISVAEDLEAIPTMGFRGEALASIASVSRLSIRSRTAGSDSAYCINIEGDVEHPIEPTSGAVGTVVTVRNLFFNTPARRKFLRTPGTEQSRCAEVVRNMALAQPNLGFRLICNGKPVLDVPPKQDPKARTLAILGKELADQLLEVSADELDAPGVTMWGLVGEPALARPTAKGQHFFINGRPIRDKTITHALHEAYRGLLDQNKKPIAVLLIDMDPALVDVNVHPAKSEVRFRDSGRIHSAVLHAVRKALTRADLTPAWTDVRKPDATHGDAQHRGWSPPKDWSAATLASTIKSHLAKAGAEVDFDTLRTAVERSTPSTDSPSDPHSDDGSMLAPARSAQRILQVHDSYLVTQDNDGLLIIDQHALHERVMFEKIMGRLNDGPLESQRLLTPITFEANRSQIDALSQLKPMLDRLGIDAEPIGPAAIAVHAFPTLLFNRKVDPAPFLPELLERAASRDLPTGQEEAIHEVVDMMSCKAAIKAGDALSDEELAEILALRERVERSSSCPHGRPTTIRLSLNDLERRFGRR